MESFNIDDIVQIKDNAYVNSRDKTKVILNGLIGKIINKYNGYDNSEIAIVLIEFNKDHYNIDTISKYKNLSNIHSVSNTFDNTNSIYISFNICTFRLEYYKNNDIISF